jgi:hypothetical protein
LPDDLLAQIREHKRAILDALARPLPPAAKSRRQKVLAIQARDGTHYAILVEDPSADPITAALATPDGTCELLIPRDRYDPFEVLVTVQGWEA